MHLQAVSVLKLTPEGGGCVAGVMAKLLPNAARTESPTGRTGECGIVIPGPKRKPTGTACGKTTFRPNAKSLSSTMGNPGKCSGCWNVARAICKGSSKPSSVAARSGDPNVF